MADLFNTNFYVEEEIREAIINWLKREKLTWEDFPKILNSIGIYPVELRKGDESCITVVTEDHKLFSVNLSYDWRHTVIYVETQNVFTEYWLVPKPDELHVIKKNSIIEYNKWKKIHVIYKKDKKIEVILKEKTQDLRIQIKECEEEVLNDLIEYLSQLNHIDIVDVVNDIWKNEDIVSSDVIISLTEKE